MNNRLDLSSIKNVVFDCDGVLLDSNEIKSEAFYNLALPYGLSLAEEFLKYHKQNGGISRNEKFKYFLDFIVKSGADQGQVDSLVKDYGLAVSELLKVTSLTEGAIDLLYYLSQQGVRMYICSGGNEEELKSIFSYKNLDHLFVGIYGSPRPKSESLALIVKSGCTIENTLFVGDSVLDNIVAKNQGMQFCYIYNYSDAKEDILATANRENIVVFSTLNDLLNGFKND